MNHNTSHVLANWIRTVAARITFDRKNESHLRAFAHFKLTSNWIDPTTNVEYKFAWNPIYPDLPTQILNTVLKNTFESIGMMDFKDEFEIAAETPAMQGLAMAQPVLRMKESTVKVVEEVAPNVRIHEPQQPRTLRDHIIAKGMVPTM
jgi:hypothetical protein